MKYELRRRHCGMGSLLSAATEEKSERKPRENRGVNERLGQKRIPDEDDVRLRDLILLMMICRQPRYE